MESRSAAYAQCSADSLGDYLTRQLRVRVLILLASALVGACGIFDAPDHLRAYRARGRIKKGMTLPQVFDELSQVRGSGQWDGMLAGFSCNLDGQKRTWVLSRLDSGYVATTHLEDTPLGGTGDWNEVALADLQAVRAFLSQRASGSCSAYRSNFGRWGFEISLASRSQRVRKVRPLEYEATD